MNPPHLCLFCPKAFTSNTELNIHQKTKHQPLSNSDNINSSDISDQEELNLKRFRQFYKKKTQNIESIKNIEKVQGDENTNKNKLPGRFDDPELQQNGSKKVYLCGCSHKAFEGSETLTRHISKQHNGFPPDGSLFGVCRDLVMRQFQPIEEKAPLVKPFIEKIQFACGCGLSYIHATSLKYHIKQNHEGIIPLGTRGLPKGSKINNEKQLIEQKIKISQIDQYQQIKLQ